MKLKTQKILDKVVEIQDELETLYNEECASKRIEPTDTEEDLLFRDAFEHFLNNFDDSLAMLNRCKS